MAASGQFFPPASARSAKILSGGVKYTILLRSLKSRGLRQRNAFHFPEALDKSEGFVKTESQPARAESASEASPADDNQIVLVELPFSSFELTEGVAQHLRLTESQKEAIRQVMARERHNMEPLFAQLRSVRGKLLALDVQHSNKKDIKTLADEQAALLARFIVANARMQAEIYKLLTTWFYIEIYRLDHRFPIYGLERDLRHHLVPEFSGPRILRGSLSLPRAKDANKFKLIHYRNFNVTKRAWAGPVAGLLPSRTRPPTTGENPRDGTPASPGRLKAACRCNCLGWKLTPFFHSDCGSLPCQGKTGDRRAVSLWQPERHRSPSED